MCEKVADNLAALRPSGSIPLDLQSQCLDGVGRPAYSEHGWPGGLTADGRRAITLREEPEIAPSRSQARSVTVVCAAAIAVALGAGLRGILAQEGRAEIPPTGTVYYVDFENGQDDGDGQTRESAFKHCPGDAEATGRAAGVELAAGDKVIFKGGVDYRGTVTVQWSGTEGNPIVYDGNTDGTFGTGRAVIQGGEPVTGWRKVASAEDVQGNPHWQELYATYLDERYSFLNFSLYEGDTYLNPAQDPKVFDPFFHDRLASYRQTDTADQGSVTDPEYFTSPDADYYDGAYIGIHVQPNFIVFQQVTGYVPAEHTVRYRPH